MFQLVDFKERIACITPEGEQLSYGALQELTEKIKNRVQPHQLVFCMCGNTIGSLAGYVSFVENKNATLMLDAHIELTAFDTLYSMYKPRYIWAPNEFSAPEEASQKYAEQ